MFNLPAQIPVMNHLDRRTVPGLASALALATLSLPVLAQQRCQLTADARCGARKVMAEFAEGTAPPTLQRTSRFDTRNRATDRSRKVAWRADAQTPRDWTQPAEQMPTDDIVRDTAMEIVAGARTDFDKTQRSYDWIVDNTCREPKGRGCGVGDIKAMLETRNFGGKCGDINGGNWLACNVAHEVALPGSSGPRIGFLTYPQAEQAGGRSDPLAPGDFKYTIAAREISKA